MDNFGHSEKWLGGMASYFCGRIQRNIYVQVTLSKNETKTAPKSHIQKLEFAFGTKPVSTSQERNRVDALNQEGSPFPLKRHYGSVVLRSIVHCSNIMLAGLGMLLILNGQRGAVEYISR